MNNTTQTWLDQVTTTTERVLESLEALGTDDRLHVEVLAQQLHEELSLDVPLNTLKLMLSSLIESTPGFKVVRGKFGGAMRDVPENRPKAEIRKEEVAARKAERAAAKVAREQEKEAKRAEKEAAKAAAAAEKAATEAAAAATEAENSEPANNQSASDEAVAV